ncbi:cystatin-M-like [Megalops cyprinoides]|uniref:cystatin-M-like n=1 Tax=Megalops cyprinoides TaxID=118141 RepID=UPI00186480C3|nr:cystatin-M-like [Megalops cyprinoides]
MTRFLLLLLAAAFISRSACADSEVLSPSSPQVQQVANFAVETYNRMNSYAYAYRVMAIQSVSAQIYPPSYMKYTMTVEVGQTICKNQPNVNLKDCSLQSSGKTMTCRFVVLAVPNSDFSSHLLEDQCR